MDTQATPFSASDRPRPVHVEDDELKVLVAGASPLFQEAVCLLVRRLLPGCTFQSMTISQLSSIPEPSCRLIIACQMTGGQRHTGWWARGTQGRGVLFTPVLGRLEQRLVEDGRWALCLPLAVDEADAEVLMGRVVAGEQGVGVRALKQAGIRERFLPAVEDFTPMERRIVRHLGQGLNNEAIAARLRVERHVVRDQLSRLCRRLGYRNRTHAAACLNRLAL